MKFHTIRRAFQPVVAIAGLIGVSTSASALGIWEGTLRIDSVTGCGTSVRLEPGETWQAFLLPPNVGGNDNKSLLRIRDLYWSYTFKTNSGRITAGGSYSGVAIDPFTQVTNWNATVQTATVTPSAIGASTPSLNVSYRFANVAGIPGCTVATHGVLLRRISI